MLSDCTLIDQGAKLILKQHDSVKKLKLTVMTEIEKLIIRYIFIEFVQERVSRPELFNVLSAKTKEAQTLSNISFTSFNEQTTKIMTTS